MYICVYMAVSAGTCMHVYMLVCARAHMHVPR